MLTSFRVEPPVGDFQNEGTIVDCFDGNELIAWAFVSHDAIDACFPERRLTNDERNLLVARNRTLIGRIIAELYAAGEHVPWRRAGETRPLVVVTPDDLHHQGVSVSKFVLDISGKSHPG
ncbi:MAG TPA: hypothetical protein VGU20_22900 [Stellaceae bacterium]|nr:hypothetical protein [Stellaceae bacterium]